MQQIYVISCTYKIIYHFVWKPGYQGFYGEPQYAYRKAVGGIKNQGGVPKCSELTDVQKAQGVQCEKGKYLFLYANTKIKENLNSGIIAYMQDIK